MAGKKAGTGAGKAGAESGSNGKVAMPAGYQRATADNSAPWWIREEGARFHGELLGKFTMNTDPPRDFYQLRAVDECKCIKGKGEEAEEVIVKKGELFNVGSNTRIVQGIEPLIPQVAAGARIAVFGVITGAKIPTKGGRSVWPVEIGFKIVVAAKQAVVPVQAAASAGGGSEGDDDLPF